MPSLLRREQFAQALGVPAEQLKVKLKKDGGGAGRRQLEADLDLPRSMASWSAAQFSEWLVGLGSGAASWVALAWVLLPPLRRPPPPRSSRAHAAAPRRREASEREQIDGPTATEMLREDWLELGASGIKASKIMAMVASRAQRA